MLAENLQLKTQVTRLEDELKRKDGMIKKYLLEVNNEEDRILEQQKIKKQGAEQLNFVYKRMIRELKSDLLLKDEEVRTMSSSLKATRFKELLAELDSTNLECQRLKAAYADVLTRKAVDPH